MHVLPVRNVHEALPEALDFLKRNGVERDSRYGKVLLSPIPVATMYEKPNERVIFWPERDANPFFHFAECLWMMAGRRDVKMLEKFAARMKTFSDDGKTFRAAYGHRWRNHFKMDQLSIIIERLKNNKDDRRQVLQIWDSKTDLADQNTKDVPCNLMATFQINFLGELDMVVFNRSNDVVWGCYGANAVHFSFLQEYMAQCIGVPLGIYTQISVNWHGYLETVTPLLHLADQRKDPHRLVLNNPYINGGAVPFPIMNTDEKTWNEDLQMFLNREIEFGYRDPFFRRVAMPMFAAHDAYKAGNAQHAHEILEQCLAQDWRIAAQEWIARRVAAKAAKEAANGTDSATA